MALPRSPSFASSRASTAWAPVGDHDVRAVAAQALEAGLHTAQEVADGLAIGGDFGLQCAKRCFHVIETTEQRAGRSQRQLVGLSRPPPARQD